jgi:hypothetical protein
MGDALPATTLDQRLDVPPPPAAVDARGAGVDARIPSIPDTAPDTAPLPPDASAPRDSAPDAPPSEPPDPCQGKIGEIPGVCDGDRTCANGACLLKDGRNCRAANDCASLRCDLGYFRDADRDGYGDKRVSTSTGFCGAAPSGWARNNTDCCDGDADVNPAQTTFRLRMSGCGGFDYNCDGTDQPEYPSRYNATTCTSGWRDTVPACGARNIWWELRPEPMCRFLEEERIQSCR